MDWRWVSDCVHCAELNRIAATTQVAHLLYYMTYLSRLTRLLLATDYLQDCLINIRVDLGRGMWLVCEAQIIHRQMSLVWNRK